MISWSDLSPTAVLYLSLTLVTVVLILYVYAVRKQRKRRLLNTLRRRPVLGLQPDGRRSAQPLAAHLWHWSAVSPDLLHGAVQAAGPTLHGDGPMRALETEIQARGAALTPAIQHVEACRFSHSTLIGHLKTLPAGWTLAAGVPPLIPSADELCDITCKSVDTGLLPADVLNGVPLDALAHVAPVLAIIDSTNRVRRRTQAGQTHQTAVDITVREGLGRGTGAFGGGKVGALAGSLLGPGGIALGAVVGAYVGGKAGQHLAQNGRRALLKQWEADLALELDDVGDELVGTSDRRRRVEQDLIGVQDPPRAALRTVRRAMRRRALHPRRWLRPDPCLVLLQEVERYGARATRQTVSEVATLRRFVRQADPARIAALLLHDVPRCERLGATLARVQWAQELAHHIQTERRLLR